MELSEEGGTAGEPTVLQVAGEVDVHSAPELGKRITAIIDGGARQLVVDLDRVEFIDSTGLGVLVAGYNRAQEQGGSLELVCASDRVIRLLRITGLDEVFTIRSAGSAGAAEDTA